MIFLTLDFETAFGVSPSGRKVTLSSMTTEEYVRDPEFKVHGCGLKLNDRPAKYFRGEELEAVFAKIPWRKTYLLTHHAHFDGAILNWHYGHKPKMHLDTLSMARAIYPYESSSLGNMGKVLGLGEKGHELINTRNKWHLTDEEHEALGAYCATNEDSDLNLTYRLFHALKHHFPADELRLIDMTVRLFTEPTLEVETGILLMEYKRERRAKKALVDQCVTNKTTLSSNDKFAQLLLDLGIDPPKKISPSKIKDGRVNPESAGEPPLGLLPSFKAAKGMSKEEKDKLKEEKKYYPWAYACGKSDEKFKLLQDHPDERVRAIAEARLGVKSTIKETRAKRFYKIGKRGKFPIYLKYYGAHTNRFSGGDKQNAQNLNRIDPNDPTSGALRRSLLAPPGHVCVVRDLSQIEARMLVYWAGQTDMVRVFERGGDPYNHMGGQIVGREIDRKNNPDDKIPGMVGKSSVLGCGYGLGWANFQAQLRVGFMGMPGVLFGEEEARTLRVPVYEILGQRSYKPGFATVRDEAMAMKPLNIELETHLTHCAVVKHIVGSYRQANHRIKALWAEMQQALDAIIEGEEISCGEHGLITTCSEGLRLPNGMLIRYHKLRKTSSGDYKYLADRKKKQWVYIYGGKVVENCIAEGTQVLTDRGWVSLENIKINDKVHDGVDFIPHGGVVFKSLQTCISVDGVHMTPDHEVLTDDGWQEAAASSQSRLYRPRVRIPDSNSPSTLRRKKTLVGVPLPVWSASVEARSGHNQRAQARGNPQLRVSDPNLAGKPKDTWNVKTPRILGVAVDERSLSSTFASSMAQLRSTWHHGMRSVVRFLRELLGGYERWLPAGADFGATGQRRSLLSGELPVGRSQEPSEQQAREHKDFYTEGLYDRCSGVGTVRSWCDYDSLQDKTRMAGGQTPDTPGLHESRVYDILNCGPRQRFVVLGESGPLIVHNCTQALSRLVLTDQMLPVRKHYPIVTSTHDEMVCVVPEEQGQQCLDYMGEVMSQPPAWCSGLPLASEGGWAKSYGDCDK